MTTSSQACIECPRACGAHRTQGQRGFCGADERIMLARAALHFWEEPPLSGQRGSGAVFFSHCPLRCLYCQNASIARGEVGQEITIERLSDICLELQKQNALNINFVTPTHYASQIRRAVKLSRNRGLTLPVVWNTSGYENVDVVSANKEVVDIYLTDFKYADSRKAFQYSHAQDYPLVALKALEAMVEQTGEPDFDSVDDQPRMTRGVVVRHMMLPQSLEDSKKVIQLVYNRLGNSVIFSLMNQYTPVIKNFAEQGDTQAQQTLARYPELGCKVDNEDYERLLDYADELGIEDYFWQEGGACEESFIPPFDLSGVEKPSL